MAESDGEPSPVLSKESHEGVPMAAAAHPLTKPNITHGTAITTIKCSELSNGGFFKNGSTFLKTKNYKAGSKINQLADMLAKRSLKVVEVLKKEDAVECVPQTTALDTPPLPPPPPAPDEEMPVTQSLKTEEVPEVAFVPIPSSDSPLSPPPPLLSSAETTLKVEPDETPSPPTALNNSEDSTKEKPVKTRSSPRCRKDVNPVQTDSVARRGKTKKQLRRSKKLVEMSTQTAEIQFISIVKDDELPLPVDPAIEPAPLFLPESPTFICLFCQLTFADKTDCLNHEATHSLKRKTKFIKCQFCSKKLPNLEEFKSHGTKFHGSNFHLCAECDLRFLNNESLVLHTKTDHYIFDPLEKTQFTILNKKVRTGTSLDVDVTFDSSKKQSISPRCVQKLSPKEKSEEQLYEAEMLFYSHLSGNIHENLSRHLDGKIDQFESSNDVVEPTRSSCVLTVAPCSSGSTSVPVTRAPSPYQTRSKTPNPLPTSAKKFKKLPNWQQKFWEKYNFPTNYRFEHRFWDKNYIHTEKSPLYLKDLSCLDIKTQLTMRENVKKLEEDPKVVRDEDERLKDTFPYFLNIVPRGDVLPSETETTVASKVETTKLPKKKLGKEGKAARRARPAVETPLPQVVTRRQSGMDGARQRKGSLDLGAEKKMSLRRQTSLENLEGSNVEKEGMSTPDESNDTGKDAIDTMEDNLVSQISGEWVRSRSYLCGTCYVKFTSLWELEDHKWATHPNVWCTHYEFEDEKLEKLFQLEAESPQVAQITLPDLYRRYLQPQGSLHLAETVSNTPFPHPCAKCKKLSHNQSELHKHMLDCGGDTTWFLTMCSSPAAMKRRWRPYGSRRRKQMGQRGVKRNIPATPTMRSYCTQPKIRTKPGDVESIQKMLANLPEKRTRRAINFDEINTRSQTTIHSNRLLRKRFNVSFGSNFLRRKVLTTVRQRQLNRKTEPSYKRTSESSYKSTSESSSKQSSESSSKSTSDVSSETTPSSSPRRKFKLKQVSVAMTPLPLAVVPSAAVDTKKGGSKNKKVLKKPLKEVPVKKAPDEVKPLAVGENNKLKKKIVDRRGYLVKQIKNKLKASKKLMEVRKENRRRSERIKENQSKEDSEGDVFSAEESEMPIAKLTKKKKSGKIVSPKTGETAELPEMPKLDREEPVKRRVSRKNDPDLPVLKPFESGVEPAGMTTKKQNVKFKVVKKARKKVLSSVKVSPLKLVKEPKIKEINMESQKLEGSSNTVAEEINVESGSDTEPLITLKKTSDFVGRVTRRKTLRGNSSKIKQKTVLKPVEVALKKVVKTPEILQEDVTNASKVDMLEHYTEPIITPPKATEDLPVKIEEREMHNIDQTRFTNFVMERIITDKLNERLVKRKKGLSTHKRGKMQPKHSLKRLRMTVTLKEATLKVLDKPTTVSGPNKWTVSTPINDIIKFDTMPLVEEKADKTEEKNEEIAVEVIKAEPVIKLDSLQTIPKLAKLRSRQRLSKRADEQVVDIFVEKEIVDIKSVGEDVSEVENILSETQEPEKTISRCRKLRTPVEDVPKSLVASEVAVPNEIAENIFVLAPSGLNNKWKSSEDVSTTVTCGEDKESSCLKLTRTRKSSKEDVKKSLEPIIVDIIDNTSNEIPVKDVIPIFTIEEATSSEDANTKKPHKRSLISTCEAKIAEADSSAEKVSCIEDMDDKYEPKIEPEMVVSSTEPLKRGIKRPKKKEESVIELDSKDEVPSSTLLIPEELDRRSRRRSKEVPTTNEFVIDDPFLLVDELWSDLDSDSDSKQKRKVKRIKKKTPKKKIISSKEVDLEALLRNFGENKDMGSDVFIKCLPKKRKVLGGLTSRLCIERKVVLNENAYKRLSLRLFSFNKKVLRYGHQGGKLLKIKKILLETIALPKLPFLPSEVTENPEQVIVCRSTKLKPTKKHEEEVEPKQVNQLKISLPLELLGDLSMFNNNHLRAAVAEPIVAPKPECCSRPVTPEVKPPEVKPKRSEVIDKIFYCEICKTYYYSPSQLKNHKMSNRHKLKETELLEGGSEEAEVAPEPSTPVVETPSATETAEPEVDKVGDDTSEMPVLEGPFIETKVELRPEPLQSQQSSVFAFSEESLKDIQRAIGCTDEEMLILTLLGENTVPEPDILDLSNLTSKAEAEKRAKAEVKPEKAEKTNGALKIDLKQRMTTALASLVNRAVNNLLNKSETMTKSAEKSDAVTFLNKLSGFSGRRKSISHCDIALDTMPNAGESSEVRYKYQCTICGNRFEKESTRDYHMVRTHRVGKRSKAAKQDVEEQPPTDEWNESWYDADDFNAVPSTQFWCSDCGINFLSPKEVMEHQKVEHPPEPSRPAVVEEDEVKPPIQKRVTGLDPDQERLLANQELQKLVARRAPKKSRKANFGVDAVKFKKVENHNSVRKPVQNVLNTPAVIKSEIKEAVKIETEPSSTKKVTGVVLTSNKLLSWKPKTSVDIYDFNEFDSDPEPVVLAHVRKSGTKGRDLEEDEDSEDNIPLSSVKVPRGDVADAVEAPLSPPDTDELINKDKEPPKAIENIDVERKAESFKISLENRFLRLDKIKLKKSTPSASEEDDSMPLFLMSKKEPLPNSEADSSISPIVEDSDDQVNENVIYQRNESLSSYESHGLEGHSSRVSESESSLTKSDSYSTDSEEENTRNRRQKKIVPLLTATLTNTDRKSESPKLNKEVIVKKIWSRHRVKMLNEESWQSDIDKEVIMKRVWKKKRVEAEEDAERSSDDVKINQTEFSDEVVIKCGPRPKINRRRSLNETAKDAIVRRIWSGKCAFQTKAALKTYDSDVLPLLPEHLPPTSPPNPPLSQPAKRRGRPASIPSAIKRKKVSSASQDDLDSLLEEIEQEDVEKAIRLEFLHMRRTEKNQVESPKEPPGLFAEIQPSEVGSTPEKKRRKIRKNVKLLKRRQDVNDFRNRRHKKHRHRHHHHKHKHKKSRHHKRIVTKHRTRHRPEMADTPEDEQGEDLEPHRELERMCEGIPPVTDGSSLARRSDADKLTEPRISSDLDNLDLKLDEILSPYECENRLNGDVSEDEFAVKNIYKS